MIHLVSKKENKMDLRIVTGLELLVSIINNSKLKLSHWNTFGDSNSDKMMQIEKKIKRYYDLLLSNDCNKVNSINEIDSLTIELFEESPWFCVEYRSVSFTIELVSGPRSLPENFDVKYFNNKIYGKDKHLENDSYKEHIFSMKLNYSEKFNSTNFQDANELIELLDFEGIDIKKFVAC